MTLSLDDLGDVDDETVVVVGLGPVGAVAALALARRGTSVVVLERDVAASMDPLESRASTFHPPTLEMLDDLGIAEELHESGLIASRYQYRDRRTGVIADFDLTASLRDDTRYPYRLQSEQSNLVEIIRRRLEADPHVRMLSGASLEALTQVGSRTILTVTQGSQHRVIDAHWVIGADGSTSVVRQALGIDFTGMTYPEQFLVASTTTDMAQLIPDIAYVNYVSDPTEWLVLLRTPRHWRVLFPVEEGSDVEALLDPAAIEARLQSVASHQPGYVVSHTTLYRVHQRVAASFAHGHALLVGDAAHINNPLGGMGMNSGIHDALAAADALVVAIGGDDTAIADYDRGRRRVALEYVQQATHRNWQVMKERDAGQREANHADLRRTVADPVLARNYLMKSSMLAAVRAEQAARPTAPA